MKNDNLGAKLHSTMDADVWAKEFMSTFKNHSGKNAWSAWIDVDLMRSWFANSIMCGWDHAHQRQNQNLSIAVEAFEEILKEAGTSTLTNKICVRTLEKIKTGQSKDRSQQVLNFCAGLISTMDQFREKHPEEVRDWILKQIQEMNDKDAEYEREFREAKQP